MQFSTTEMDNDDYTEMNCAAVRGNGGNWYGSCASQVLNGIYGGDGGGEYMYWYNFDVDDRFMALEKMRWMVREVV